MNNIAQGIVIKGKGEGKKIGYPTANIKLKIPIESGIYRGEVIVDMKKYEGAVFIAKGRNVLEAHLFDFKEDLYGKEIIVEIKEKIRDVTPYKNERQMKTLIAQDIAIIKSRGKN